jgi:SAM-dependent methyltransferase
LTSSFGAAASTYDAAARPQRLAASRLVAEAWHSISAACGIEGETLPDGVIDLGCGTGLVAAAWLEQLQAQGQPLPRQLLLVDQAPEMVERAVERLRAWQCPQQGMVVDAFADAAVEALVPLLAPEASHPRLVLSSYALQWSAAPLEVLKTVWGRLLRPGEWLAVAVPDDRSFAVLRAALAEADLPSHLLALPASDALIGAAARSTLSDGFAWVDGGSFANGVPVASALDYLRHFTRIGARSGRSLYSRGQLTRLCRCLDQQLSAGAAELDYHSTWMVLRRLSPSQASR